MDYITRLYKRVPPLVNPAFASIFAASISVSALFAGHLLGWHLAYAVELALFFACTWAFCYIATRTQGVAHDVFSQSILLAVLNGAVIIAASVL